MRSLCSAKSSCKGQCKYCFAGWNDLYKKQPLLEDISINDDYVILYPCCDGEFFDQDGIVESIANISKKFSRLYISISTKRILQENELEQIIALNQKLVAEKKGFVKISVSVSTKTQIEEIEPNTMKYSERLELVKRFKESNITTSLTLKPVLPFIANQEYYEIIHDFCPYIYGITVGGLYVNPSSSFFNMYIKNRYPYRKRRVSWLDEHPEWLYIEEDGKIESIKEYAVKQNILVFDSDESLINSITKRME